MVEQLKFKTLDREEFAAVPQNLLGFGFRSKLELLFTYVHGQNLSSDEEADSNGGEVDNPAGQLQQMSCVNHRGKVQGYHKKGDSFLFPFCYIITKNRKCSEPDFKGEFFTRALNHSCSGFFKRKATFIDSFIRDGYLL